MADLLPPFDDFDDAADPLSAVQPMRRADGGRNLLRLRAAHSADRITRSLSPWIQEALGANGAPAKGTLLRRLLRNRQHDSFTFNSTLAILKRFHRIVTRSVSFQANVGTIDPNLFDRFSAEMARSSQIGVNNMGELFKLSERDNPLDMPLAGAPGTGQPQPAQPAEPPRPVSLEDIRKRIEEARLFRSQSSSAEPDFVQAQRKAASPPLPGIPPAPAPQRPAMPPQWPTPAERPNLPAAAAQPPEPPPSDPAALSPRVQRRRYARKVEYLSMPSEEDDGDSSDGEPHFAGDNEDPVSNLAFFADAPLFDELAASIPTYPAADTAQFSLAQPVADENAATIQRLVKRRRATHRRPHRIESRQPASRLWGRTSGPPAPPSIAQRSLTHLRQSTSGQMLASRPQSLLRYIQRQPQAARPLEQTYLEQGEPSTLAWPTPAPGDPLTATRHSLPVALTDFVLPPLRRLMTWRTEDDITPPDASAMQPLSDQLAPVHMARRVQPTPGQRTATIQRQPTPSSRPLPPRAHTLAELQIHPLRPAPTVWQRDIARTPKPPFLAERSLEAISQLWQSTDLPALASSARPDFSPPQTDAPLRPVTDAVWSPLDLAVQRFAQATVSTPLPTQIGTVEMPTPTQTHQAIERRPQERLRATRLASVQPDRNGYTVQAQRQTTPSLWKRIAQRNFSDTRAARLGSEAIKPPRLPKPDAIFAQGEPGGQPSATRLVADPAPVRPTHQHTATLSQRLAERSVVQRTLEPISQSWQTADLWPIVPATQPPFPTQSADPIPAVAAQWTPLDLAVQRFAQAAASMLPAQTATMEMHSPTTAETRRAVDQLTRSRSQLAPFVSPEPNRQTVQRERSPQTQLRAQPAAPALWRRVAQRDFGGTRAATLASGPLRLPATPKAARISTQGEGLAPPRARRPDVGSVPLAHPPHGHTARLSRTLAALSRRSAATDKSQPAALQRQPAQATGETPPSVTIRLAPGGLGQRITALAERAALQRHVEPISQSWQPDTQPLPITRPDFPAETSDPRPSALTATWSPLEYAVQRFAHTTATDRSFAQTVAAEILTPSATQLRQAVERIQPPRPRAAQAQRLVNPPAPRQATDSPRPGLPITATAQADAPDQSRANEAQARVSITRPLWERVAQRDFSGTRAESLSEGPLARSLPAPASPNVKTPRTALLSRTLATLSHADFSRPGVRRNFSGTRRDHLTRQRVAQTDSSSTAHNRTRQPALPSPRFPNVPSQVGIVGSTAQPVQARRFPRNGEGRHSEPRLEPGATVQAAADLWTRRTRQYGMEPVSRSWHATQWLSSEATRDMESSAAEPIFALDEANERFALPTLEQPRPERALPRTRNEDPQEIIQASFTALDLPLRQLAQTAAPAAQSLELGTGRIEQVTPQVKISRLVQPPPARPKQTAATVHAVLRGGQTEK